MDGLCHRPHGLLLQVWIKDVDQQEGVAFHQESCLSDDPVVELVSQVQQLLALRGNQLGDGDPRPTADHSGDVTLANLDGWVAAVGIAFGASERWPGLTSQGQQFE